MQCLESNSIWPPSSPQSPPSSLSRFVLAPGEGQWTSQSVQITLHGEERHLTAKPFTSRQGQKHRVIGVHGECNSHQPLGLPYCFCSVFQKVFRGGERAWRKAGLCLLSDISMRSPPSPHSMSGISPCKGEAIRQGTTKGSGLFCPAAHSTCLPLLKRLFSTEHVPCMERIPPLVCSHSYPPLVN